MSYKLRNIFTMVLITISVAAINTMAQTRAYTATDRQVQYLINRIETRTDTFKRNMNTALDQSKLNNTETEDMIFDYIANFENTTDSLKQKFDARESVSQDVQNVLNQAANINQFMKNNRLTTKVQSDWNYLRTDITTLSRYYNVSWDWNSPINNDTNNTTRPYRVSDITVQTLLARIETSTDLYRRSVERAIRRSSINNTNREDNIVEFINDFEKETDNLKQKFDSRTSVNNDVSDLLSRAYYIDSFMKRNRLNAASQRDWRNLRSDLNTLANYYGVSWNWNQVPQQNSRTDVNGTYHLNVGQSDNVSDIVTNTVNKYYTGNQRERVQNNLERRLTPPNMMAIEKIGQQVTIGSSLAQQVSFTADGVARTEVNDNGRSVKITASSKNDGVALSYEGDRINDFYVDFMPMSNGQLKVIRRVYLENRNETVTVTSVYDKVNPTAQWSVLNNNQNTSNNTTYEQFIVPNNTKLTAVLMNTVSTKTSQDGDQFQMRVTSPSEYEGAVIEGRVVKPERSGRVSGRANVSLVFDTIRLRNGQTYKFAGLVDEVKLPNGETVTVNNEGTVRDNNQTNKTITRGAIGAGIGAIIGAIAGGGKGAVIGAVVGGGAGAGSVLIQGKDDVELNDGTEFQVTATAPNNLNSSR
ncbi:hypothetical protein BH10ACI1_BH10ACI1_28340 [soil metagenome]